MDGGNSMTMLRWPLHFPDINPIDNLWQHMKTQLCKHKTPSKGVWEVWDRASEVWENLEPEMCQNLIESMPRRVGAVMKAKGGHTKY